MSSKHQRLPVPETSRCNSLRTTGSPLLPPAAEGAEQGEQGGGPGDDVLALLQVAANFEINAILWDKHFEISAKCTILYPPS